MKSLNRVTEIARDWIGASQDLELLEKEFSSVKFEGKKYILSQFAYLTGTHDEPYYEAYAYGLDYKTYLVKWVITADINSPDYDVDNSDDDCDWANPISVTPI